MTRQRFDIDRARLASAHVLAPDNHADFQRLSKKLAYGPAFQLLLIDCRDQLLQRQLQALLQPVADAAGLRSASLMLDDTLPDVAVLEARLQQLAAGHDIIHLSAAAAWLDEAQHPGRWAHLNVLRERVAAQVGRRLLLWLNEDAIAQMVDLAPDWWAWRSGVYLFVSEPAPVPAAAELAPRFTQLDKQSQDKAARRIAELRSWLAASMAPELALPLHLELGDLLARTGEPELALVQYRQHALPLAQVLGLEYGVAVIMGRVADVLLERGELDEALRIRQQEQLPVYHRLGKTHSVALTHGKIADVLVLRGELDEALRIRQQEQLPVYLQQGNDRDVAMTQGQIADVLFLRGELDEALRIRQQQELPVYQRLGDVRNIAITQGQIADILFQRGEMTQALHILQQEALPVYQRLGDVRSVALTQGKIADVLFQCGELDEALRIRQQEELPALQRLGDVHGLLVGKSMLAQYLWIRNQGQDRQQARRYLAEALADSERLGLAEAASIKKVMQDMGLGSADTGP